MPVAWKGIPNQEQAALGAGDLVLGRTEAASLDVEPPAAMGVPKEPDRSDMSLRHA